MLPVVRLILDFTVHKSVTHKGHSDKQIRPKMFNTNLAIKMLIETHYVIKWMQRADTETKHKSCTHYYAFTLLSTVKG